MLDNSVEEYGATLEWHVSKGTHLKCHPKARRAWRSWRDLERQFAPFGDMPLTLIEQLQLVNPIHVRRSTDKNNPEVFEFFGGFASVAFVMDGRLDRALFCVHNKPSTKLVQDTATSSLLTPLLYSLHRTDGLSSLYKSLNTYFSKSELKSLFPGGGLSLSRMAKLAGVGISQCRAKPASKDKIEAQGTILKAIFDENDLDY
ncbi:hypothetical protein [uncultured Zhongshania sp.]|uniref:hypothetical protein n=1 Tax=uncultured Zhongshania sp. TaxID=1642288 RepID=UPI0025DBBC57|nr:hypothetical protein [uncultured Zhongshania sp.]